MKVVTSEGDFAIEITELTREGDNLVMIGTMGVWEAKTVIMAEEMLHLLRLSLNTKVIFYLIFLPFILLKGLFRKKG